MTRYLAFCITDITHGGAVEGLVADILAPYSEDVEVAEYVRECSCVGFAAWNEVSRLASTVMFAGTGETIPSLMTKWKAEKVRIEQQHDSADSEKGKYCMSLEEYTQPWADGKNELATVLITYHPERERPDKNCTFCDGGGKYPSTYNPNSKWDCWQIGGVGLHFPDHLRNGEYPVGLESEHLPYIIKVDDLLNLNGSQFSQYGVPTAVVGKGFWCGNDYQLSASSFSQQSKPKDWWEGELKELYRNHTGKYAVAVDLHI